MSLPFFPKNVKPNKCVLKINFKITIDDQILFLFTESPTYWTSSTGIRSRPPPTATARGQPAAQSPSCWAQQFALRSAPKTPPCSRPFEVGSHFIQQYF